MVVRNLVVDGGEIDIILRDSSQLVVAEVRTVTGARYPLDAIDYLKRRQVRRLAGTVGIARCDAVGVGLLPEYFVIHWDPDTF